MSAADTCEVCRRHPWSGHNLDCPNRMPIPPAEDERITAWQTLVKHPIFADCFRDGVLLDHMLAKLAELSSQRTDDVRELIAEADVAEWAIRVTLRFDLNWSADSARSFAAQITPGVQKRIEEARS